MVAGPRKVKWAGNSVRILVRSCPVLNALACTWQSHVALQVVKTTGYSHTEKAGVGGSTPSLASTFKALARPPNGSYVPKRSHFLRMDVWALAYATCMGNP